MNKNDKTLVILSPGFPANEADTTCLPPQQLFIKALNQNFPSLNIIILSFQYPFFNAEYKWNNNKVIAFGGKHKAKVNRLLLWLRIWKTLKKINKENNIIGLFSFWCGECALIGKWFGKRNEIKHYAWISGQDAKKGNKYIKWIRPKPDELIAMSDFLADEFFKNYFTGPAHIIPIGIAPEMFSPDGSEKNIDIMGAGSLIPLKQYDSFVRVIKKLAGQLPSVKSILCGKGPEEKKLKTLIAQNHLENNISLAGEIEHPQVLKFMQQTKVFLHTSSYEGFGSVCIEALYAGAHVISFCQPMKEPINHWHIVSTEEEMYAKALAILQNPQTSYEPAFPFSMSNTAREVMELFE